MDYRFPKWLRVVVRKLDFLAIPNLGQILAACAAIGFFAAELNPHLIARFGFDADLIWYGGEWYRLLSFPFLTGASTSGLLFLLFHCLYVYYICTLLESNWGTGPLSVYLIFSYLCTMAGALFFPSHFMMAIYVIQNLSLVVGTLLPDIEFTVYFLIPVKAKWLAGLSAAWILFTFLGASNPNFRIALLFAFFPYLLFFGPLLFNRGKDAWKRKKNRDKFNRNMWN